MGLFWQFFTLANRSENGSMWSEVQPRWVSMQSWFDVAMSTIMKIEESRFVIWNHKNVKIGWIMTIKWINISIEKVTYKKFTWT